MNANFNVENFSHKAYVRVSEDEMKAFLTLADIEEQDAITKEILELVLKEKGINYGLIETNLTDMLSHRLYNHEVLIATGKEPVDGEAGFYDLKFNPQPNTKPTINPDGTVNYWSMSLVENVTEGQVIAVYHPSKPGESGMTVTRKMIPARIMKDLPCLKGKGFIRLEDNVTYIATMNGKIEYLEDRIHISNIYEVNDNLDYCNGKIDFRGDVIIHGNVMTGAEIQAYGSITVDGNVEGARLIAKKDIILRSGVQGDGKAYIQSGGNIYAKFFESATVDAKGFIVANILMNSTVSSGDYIELSGNRATIIGGYTYAVKWIRAMNIGNYSELKTKVAVGINDDAIVRIRDLSDQIEDNKQLLANLNDELIGIEEVDNQSAEKIELFRDKIKYTSLISEYQFELSDLLERAEKSKGAYISVGNTVYPGVSIQANSSVLRIRERLVAVQFKLYGLDIAVSKFAGEE